MNTVPITDIRNQTDISPITLARLGVIPRYRVGGVDHYNPVDVLQGIQRQFSPPETQTVSHAAAANYIGIPEQELTGLANQYSLRPDDTGAWSVPDVRQLYFVNNYSQGDTSSEQDAANLTGMPPQVLREFAKQYGYGSYTFINGKPHYTELQVKGIKSKLQEIRDEKIRQGWGWS